jgi:hypothetical protein
MAEKETKGGFASTAKEKIKEKVEEIAKKGGGKTPDQGRSLREDQNEQDEGLEDLTGGEGMTEEARRKAAEDFKKKAG